MQTTKEVIVIVIPIFMANTFSSNCRSKTVVTSNVYKDVWIRISRFNNYDIWTNCRI